MLDDIVNSGVESTVTVRVNELCQRQVGYSHVEERLVLNVPNLCLMGERHVNHEPISDMVVPLPLGCDEKAKVVFNCPVLDLRPDHYCSGKRVDSDISLRCIIVLWGFLVGIGH